MGRVAPMSKVVTALKVDCSFFTTGHPSTDSAIGDHTKESFRAFKRASWQVFTPHLHQQVGYHSMSHCLARAERRLLQEHGLHVRNMKECAGFSDSRVGHAAPTEPLSTQCICFAHASTSRMQSHQECLLGAGFHASNDFVLSTDGTVTKAHCYYYKAPITRLRHFCTANPQKRLAAFVHACAAGLRIVLLSSRGA